MWTRAELKSLAKTSLKENYWKAFLIGLVISLASGEGGGGFGRLEYKLGEHIGSNPELIIVSAGMILTFAYRLLLGYSLEVGSKKYFVQLGQFKNTEGCYSFAFDGSNYKGIISTMLVRDIYIFLWSLLFIIPGIIKSYSYRMVPYILADNPNLGVNEAITLSRKMMDGNKFDSFVLDLSFIGWILLGTLAFVIGIFFVNPYIFATDAQLYLFLRKNALYQQFCTYDDLNLKRETGSYDNYSGSNDYFRHDDY